MARGFNVERYHDRLSTSWIGTDFNYIEQTASTNSLVKTIPSDKLVHGAVFLADVQKNGRGQYERIWEAAPFSNLTFTLLFKPPGSNRLPLLSLSIAVAISKTLEKFLDEPVQVKWPNDIICKGKKLGGILTETSFCGSVLERLLVGVGLNVNQTVFSRTIDKKTTSMKSIANKTFSREELLAAILNETEQSYYRWHKFDQHHLREINNRLIGYGEWVNITIYNEIQPGLFKFIGLNDKGELLMLNEQMDVNKFSYEQIRIIPGSYKISERDREVSA
ncbi:MAG: biotin--[acetyl-CoA-carboxylase] ligase [Balneolaceae bacterium]|nr:biotin--[acetyl-CoA-carboxylase] ligase [Balneolaceae bacterium]